MKKYISRFRYWIYSLVLALTAYFGASLYAVDNALSGNAPTTNTDNTPLTNLTAIRLYKVIDTRATPNCATATFVVYQTLPFSTVGGAFSYMDLNQNTNGRYCYRATAVNSFGTESAPSAIVFKDIDTRIPNAPTNLVVN